MKQLSTALIVCALAVAGAAVAQKGGTTGTTGSGTSGTGTSTTGTGTGTTGTGTSTTGTGTGTSTTGTTGTTGGSSSSATGQAGMDADAMAQLCQINENEIVAAGVAESKKVTGPVMEYAQMLRREHSQNLVDTMALAGKSKMTITDTPAAMELHKKAGAELATLAAMDGDKFQKGFVDMMVRGHTDALTKLDGFIAQTKNADLKKHLQTTRGHVQAHLDQAKKLQGNAAKGG